MNLQDCDPANSRFVELPFVLGQIVHHKCSPEKNPGIVTGFTVRERGVLVCVVWGKDLGEGHHSVLELTTEYIKDFFSE